MEFPYKVMRMLSGPLAESSARAFEAQLQAIEIRTLRQLQAGTDRARAEDLEQLIEGCRAAAAVLEEIPSIIERWRRTPRIREDDRSREMDDR